MKTVADHFRLSRRMTDVRNETMRSSGAATPRVAAHIPARKRSLHCLHRTTDAAGGRRAA